MSNRNLPLLGLTSSLEGNGPDHVVTILGVEIRNDLTVPGEGWFGTASLRPLRGQWLALGRGAERGLKSCRATQEICSEGRFGIVTLSPLRSQWLQPGRRAEGGLKGCRAA